MRHVADVLGRGLGVIVPAVEADLAAIRMLANEGAEERGLAGAVEADERGDFAAGDGRGNAVEHGPTAEHHL